MREESHHLRHLRDRVLSDYCSVFWEKPKVVAVTASHSSSGRLEISSINYLSWCQACEIYARQLDVAFSRKRFYLFVRLNQIWFDVGCDRILVFHCSGNATHQRFEDNSEFDSAWREAGDFLIKSSQFAVRQLNNPAASSAETGDEIGKFWEIKLAVLLDGESSYVHRLLNYESGSYCIFIAINLNARKQSFQFIFAESIASDQQRGSPSLNHFCSFPFEIESEIYWRASIAKHKTFSSWP